MTLVQTLKEFSSGKLSRTQLLEVLDAPGHPELSSSTELTRVIDEVSRWGDFPDDITDVLKTRLADLGEGTLATVPFTDPSDAVTTYGGEDPYLFVSYAREDWEAVQAELRWLTGLGVHCAFDEAAAAGAEVSAAQLGRIAGCALFVCYVTPGSASAERCRVELTHALASGRPVLTVYLAPAELPADLEASLAGQRTLSRYDTSVGEYQRAFLDVLDSMDLAVEVNTVFVPGEEEQPPRRAGDLQVGDLLADRFRLEEVLGSGGMSIVYKARDLDSYDQSLVAVKVLNREFSQHRDSIVTLKREVAKTSKLVDRNIVNVRDFGESGPHAYMWMEYIPGRSLAERLRDPKAPRISSSEAMLIVEGMVRALSYAHEFPDEQIVHADFKPGNVMLTREPVTHPDQVRVIDFGIARAVKRSEDGFEPTIYDIRSLRAHTPAYASPELIANKEADPRDDVYALGCIAYEMLTGRHPFDRKSAIEARARGLRAERRKGMSREQHLAIRHALAFDRKERTPSASAFLRELKGQRSGPSRGLVATVVLALVVVVGVVGWRLAGIDRPAEPPQTFSDCDGCPEMRLLPAGPFRQGSDEAVLASGVLASETPAHDVTIAGSIAAGITEVTVAQFREFVNVTGHPSGGCYRYASGSWTFDAKAGWSDPGFPQSDLHPVTCVSWQDAVAYADWLSERTGRTYRLPSESEWEYLARAGTAGSRWFDDTGVEACRAANIADLSAGSVFADWQVSGCRDGYVYTAPVNASVPNPFGLRDTVGNVFEWVRDCWYPDYAGAPGDGSARERPDCVERVLRGGSWYSRPEYTTATFRNRFDSRHRASSFGFRVVSDRD